MNRLGFRKTLSYYFGWALEANRNRWTDSEVLERMERAEAEGFSRRKMIALSTAAATAGIVSCKSRSFKAEVKSKSKDPEVVVLGAGAAGLSAAYLLAKSGVACAVYEGNSRLGGRVWTRDNFNSEGMIIELGAEFVDSDHNALMDICSEVGVEVVDFVNHVPGLEAEVFFMGGKPLYAKELIPQFRVLAAIIIKDLDTFVTSKGIDLPTLGKETPASKFDGMSISQYLQNAQSQGLEKTFVDVIKVAYLGMYGTDPDKQNSLNLLLLIDPHSKGLGIYGSSDEAKRVKGGNSRMIEGLAMAVQRKSTIEMEHKLVRISDNGSQFTLDFQTPSGNKQVKAGRIMCCLPFTTLREVEGIFDLDLSQEKKNAIKEMGYSTNAKFVVGFKERYWRRKGNTVEPNYGAVFSDGLVKEVRDSSNGQKGNSGIIMNYLSDKEGEFVSPQLFNNTMKHLEILYPGIGKTHDGLKNLQHWPSEKFIKASYSCQLVGHYGKMGGFENLIELSGRMGFAGEHLSSDYGGYMNGAIETATQAASALARNQTGQPGENTRSRGKRKK
jgi:monoamine oxidase